MMKQPHDAATAHRLANRLRLLAEEDLPEWHRDLARDAADAIERLEKMTQELRQELEHLRALAFAPSRDGLIVTSIKGSVVNTPDGKRGGGGGGGAGT